jgi:DNA-binding NarL/FixJ family response regulator
MITNEIPGSATTRIPDEARIRLLLADDNPDMLRQVRSLLTKDFEIVASVKDGETVLQIYEDLKPQALILDISMRGISGLEVTRVLREQGNMAPVVFLTAHQEADFVRAALSCGGSAYVVKSHLTRELIPAIHAALSGRLFISPCTVVQPPVHPSDLN